MDSREAEQFSKMNDGRRAIGTRFPNGEKIEGRLSGSGCYTDLGSRRQMIVLYINEFRVDPETVKIIEGPGRFSLPEDATDPRFAYQAVKREAFAKAAGAPSVARAIEDVVCYSEPRVEHERFLGHVDELLRWAQGHTDRDLVRDRVCRALGPLLRERMGRKLG